MSYIEDNLMPNEKILYTARVHPAVFLAPLLMFIISISVFFYGVNSSQATNPDAGRIAGGFTLLISVLLFFYSILLALRADPHPAHYRVWRHRSPDHRKNRFYQAEYAGNSSAESGKSRCGPKYPGQDIELWYSIRDRDGWNYRSIYPYC